MASEHELLGRTLGEFVLEEKIGEGGFGEVFRATQPALGRAAVVKVLKPRHRSAGDLVARFVREAQLASRLDHPFAAHVYAFGAEDDGLLWIAMEHAGGLGLDRLVHAQGRLTLERLVPLLERIAEVVHSAHELGIVHRDLKPANVMVLVRAGRMYPKLLDFGIAKAIEAAVTPSRPIVLPETAEVADTMDIVTAPMTTGMTTPVAATRAGSILGSPPYMAPELWEGGSVDGRTDQYALAISVYECLTGQLPFPNRALAQMVESHRELELPPLGAEFPPALQSVLARATAKRRADRYPDVLAFAAAVRAAAGLAPGGEAVPRFAPPLLDALGDLPTPIAAPLAEASDARTLREARDAIHCAVRATARLLGAIALARHRGGALPLVAELVRRELSDAEALSLSDAEGARELAELARDADAEETVGRALPLIVQAAGGLRQARLVVPRGDVADLWRGPTRKEIAGVPGPEGRALLIGADGEALPLWPLVQVLEPLGGGPPDLFIHAGAGRLIALPAGHERRDEEIVDWLARRFPDAAPRRAAETNELERPYRGLAPFTARDAELFFGRDDEIEACRERLTMAPLLVVVGPSGAGKSSFVHAGLAPTLGGRVVAVRPGNAPLAILAARLSAALGHADPSVLLGQLAKNPASISAFLALGEPLVLVVDQLEELFTLGAAPAEREAFAAVLAAAADPAGPTRVVATLRDDFLSRAAELPALHPRLARALFLLGTPRPDELLRIVREPARRAGYQLDDDALAGDMVAAVAGRPAALALLSFTAARLWEVRDRERRLLLRDAYVGMGGVAGALGGHAEETLARMPAAARQAVREAFRHLVTAEGTRARLRRSDLEGLVGVDLVDTLLAARLLATDEEGGVELVHEALLVAWPRAVAWRRDDAEGARLRDELRDLAHHWDARRRPAALLLRGDELEAAARLRARGALALPATEAAFVDESVRASRRARRIRGGLAVATIAALLAISATFYALYDRAEVQRRDATARRDALVLLQARSAVDHDPTAALAWLKLYARTGSAWPEVQAIAVDAWSRGAARLMLRGHASAVWQVAFAPDGKSLATASWDHTVAVWDLATGTRRILAGHDDEVNALVDLGDVLFSAGDDRTVRRWQGGSGRVVGKHGSAVTALAAAANVPFVVSGGTDGAIRRFALDGAELPAVVAGGAGNVQRLALSPDGTSVASVGEGPAVAVWPIGGGRPRLLTGHAGRATAIAWSPDGRSLASADVGGEVRWWNVATGESRRVGAHDGLVRTIAFTPDSARIVTGGYDEVVSIWEDGGGRRVLRGHRGPVFGVAVSPDGARLASGGLDGRVRLWDMPPPGRVFTGFRAGQGEGVAFSPDGASIAWTAGSGLRVGRLAGGTVRELAGGARDQRTVAWAPTGTAVAAIDDAGTVRVWSGENVFSTDGAAGGEVALAFSADGRVIYFPSGKTVVRWLWAENVRRALTGPEDVPRRIVAVPGGRAAAIAGPGLWLFEADGQSRRLGDGDGYLASLALADDGHTLATGDHAAGVELWDLADGRKSVLRGHAATVEPLAFARGGKLLASGSYDKTVRVWQDGAEKATFTGHATIVRRVAIAPDGSFVVSSGNDDFIRTWDLVDGSSGAFAAHGAAVQAIALAPDGSALASGGSDGTVRLWDLSKREHVPADGPALRRWLDAATTVNEDDLR